jgi:endonuclease/exonuclease/phosphatase family metal-dependent hydrolase
LRRGKAEWTGDRVPTINLLTWNLNKREAALDALAKHVASRSLKGEHFVAAVQECADDAQAITGLLRTYGATKVHVVGNGTMSVLSSEPLQPLTIPCDTVGMRLLLTRASFAGRSIAIVNYHGEAQGLQGSPDQTERGGIASEARWRIDDHAAGDEVIVLGDFNAEPTDPEVESLYCFSFATSPTPASHKSHNRSRSHLRPAPPSRGTYLFRSNSKGERWRTFDFVVASASLAVQTQAVLGFDSVPLTDGTRPSASDHLPVAGTLDLP